jgi:hypothetical protein
MVKMVVAIARHSRFPDGAASIPGARRSVLTAGGACLGSETVAAHSNLSAKPIPARERLILALDVPSLDEGKRWVERLGDSVQFYKLGLQFLMTGGYFDMVDWLDAQGKKVFADIKFFDVPETVKHAVEQLAQRKVAFATVHGNDPMLEAAVSVKEPRQGRPGRPRLPVRSRGARALEGAAGAQAGLRRGDLLGP